MVNIRRSRAFTLIELLIALSLSSVVMVVLVGGFYQITKSWQDQEQLLDKEIDDSLIRLEIEKAISGAFPYTYLEGKNTRRIYFKGDAQSVSFISTMSPAYDNQLTIWLIKALNSGGLSIQVTSALTGDPDLITAKLSSPAQTREATIVLEDYDISFEFLLQSKNNEKSWIKTWNAYDKQSLPLAVRLTLDSNDKDRSRDESKADEVVAFILANEHQFIQPKL